MNVAAETMGRRSPIVPHPSLIHPATQDYRSFISNNRGWARFEPRAGDIYVCTSPKCGTTWMQTIAVGRDGRDAFTYRLVGKFAGLSF